MSNGMELKKKRNYVAAYVKTGTLPENKSMHLAIWDEGRWRELNFGTGILFAKADYEKNAVVGETRVMEEPYLYRQQDGRIGVTAYCYGIKQCGDRWTKIPGEGSAENATVWVTENLVEYRVLEKKESQYQLDMLRGNPPKERTWLQIEKENVLASVLSLTDAEADYLKKKLDAVRGEEVSGEYEAPLVFGIADPMVQFYEGNYYLTGTNEKGGQKDLYIRQAKTLKGLQRAEEKLFFKAAEAGEHSGCNWAPELHVIGGRLCCLFSSSLNGNWDHVQSFIMYCDGNPLDREAWTAPVRIRRADGHYLAENGISLDMTYFEAVGKHYYCWAERVIDEQGVHTSDLMIAQMNPACPEYLSSEVVKIRRPQYAWERQHATVDEGPFILKHDGKIYMSFSGNAVGDDYCVGLMSANIEADLLNPASWHEIGYPVLTSRHVRGELGPGHNSFVKDEFGQDILIYHAKPNGGMRSFYARAVHFGFDGTPLLYLSDEHISDQKF